jgi:hypothetical protein
MAPILYLSIEFEPVKELPAIIAECKGAAD